MKFPAVVSLFVLGFGLGSSVFGDDVPARHQGERRIYDNEAGASIEIPKGFRKRKGESGLFLTCEGTGENSNASMNLTLGPPPNQPIEEIAGFIKKLMPQQVKGWKLIDEGSAEIDGKKGWYLNYRHVVEDGAKQMPLQILQFYLFAKDKSFVLTFGSSEDKFPDLKKQFEASAKTFRADETPERHRGEGRIYDKEINASIVMPKGWERTKGEKGYYLTCEGPAAKGGGNLNVKSGRRGRETIEQVGGPIKKFLAQEQKEWKFIDDGFAEIDGKKAYYLNHRFLYEEGTNKIALQILQYYVLGKDKHYVLSFTSSEDKFADFKKQFEESAKTFRAD